MQPESCDLMAKLHQVKNSLAFTETTEKTLGDPQTFYVISLTIKRQLTYTVHVICKLELH